MVETHLHIQWFYTCHLCNVCPYILHNEELKGLYSSPNIVRVIKSRRTRWAGHVARMGGRERSVQGAGGETQGEETAGETQA